MDNTRKLSMEEMEKITGGSAKTIRTRQAIVRSGPGLEYGQTASLSCGTVVNFTGTISYNEDELRTWYLINSPVYGWVTRNDLGL